MRYRLVNPEPGLYRAEVRRGGRWVCIAGDGHEMVRGMRWSAGLPEVSQALKVHTILHADEGSLDLSGLKAFALGAAAMYAATGLLFLEGRVTFCRPDDDGVPVNLPKYTRDRLKSDHEKGLLPEPTRPR